MIASMLEYGGHQVEVEFPDGLRGKHTGTLLEFGKMKNGKMITAMAFTVGIPVAIGALLVLGNKIKTRGVLRPIEPEVYVPAMDILQAYGIKLMEKIEQSELTPFVFPYKDRLTRLEI